MNKSIGGLTLLDGRQDIFDGYGECDPTAPDGPESSITKAQESPSFSEDDEIYTALIPLRSLLSVIRNRNVPKMTQDDIDTIMGLARTAIVQCRKMNEPH